MGNFLFYPVFIQVPIRSAGEKVKGSVLAGRETQCKGSASLKWKTFTHSAITIQKVYLILNCIGNADSQGFIRKGEQLWRSADWMVEFSGEELSPIKVISYKRIPIQKKVIWHISHATVKTYKMVSC